MRKQTAKKKRQPPRNQCPRCHGAMVYERFQDMMDLFFAWRCLNCGEVVDPVVEKNRAEEGITRRAVG